MFSFLPRPFDSACTEIIKACSAEGLEDDDDEADEEQAGQDHVFSFYDELSPEEQRDLDDQFDRINAQEFENAWVHGADETSFAEQGIQTVPPCLMNWDLKRPPKLQPGANITKLTDVSERKWTAWQTLGLEMYSRDRVAIVIMSGGKDSRIGGQIPKGALDVGLLSHKSIFQLYIERIRRLQHLVQRKFKKAVYIPVYIMCNRDNKEIIEDFFRENEFFGIREQDVLFFTQGDYPICDKRGKYLLEEKHKIAVNPNGNGGIFKALVEEGMVSDMKSRGVTSIYVCSIDNVLAKVGDPVFIGFCDTCKADAGLKTMEKVLPEEQYGIFCSQLYRDVFEDVDGDGKLDSVSKVKASVLEFFEIPEDLKKRRKQAGSGGMPLELSAGNLSQYFFKIDFVKKVAQLHWKKWHLIPKAIPYMDLKLGHKVEPPKQDRNARRMEMFIFDAFQLCKSVVGLQVPRTEYALVKNVSGPSSPQTAVQAVGQLHQQWIIRAGGEFVDKKVAGETEDLKCEISPLVSYDGEDLEGHFLKPLALPFYLPSQMEFTDFSAATAPLARRPSTHYLDWQSDIIRHELEVELHAQLGNVLEMMEDPKKYEYHGERAANEEETLPPTPRDTGPKRPGAAGREVAQGSGSARKDSKQAETNDPSEPLAALEGPPTDTYMDPKKTINSEKRQKYWGRDASPTSARGAPSARSARGAPPSARGGPTSARGSPGEASPRERGSARGSARGGGSGSPGE